MTGPIPKTNAMLVCDYVITEQGTNKKSLIGVFENISAGKFPCTHPSLSVYIKLTEGNGVYRFRLELVELKSDRIIGKGELPNDVTMRNPRIAHELVFNLRSLRFNQAGDYEFRIFANDRIFGQKAFVVSQARSKEKPEGQ
ncbi:MAG: hypothetical protein H6757_03320 [Candidatus Omnitrophica bacterium]|nr:hypothetical protein [Candidatus Omnitrophota bacterium]